MLARYRVKPLSTLHVLCSRGLGVKQMALKGSLKCRMEGSCGGNLHAGTLIDKQQSQRSCTDLLQLYRIYCALYNNDNDEVLSDNLASFNSIQSLNAYSAESTSLNNRACSVVSSLRCVYRSLIAPSSVKSTSFTQLLFSFLRCKMHMFFPKSMYVTSLYVCGGWEENGHSL